MPATVTAAGNGDSFTQPGFADVQYFDYNMHSLKKGVSSVRIDFLLNLLFHYDFITILAGPPRRGPSDGKCKPTKVRYFNGKTI
jgi:hypothetical protein